MVPFLPGTRLLGVALILFGLCAVAQADGFSAVVVYGDSLSDNGNFVRGHRPAGCSLL